MKAGAAWSIREMLLEVFNTVIAACDGEWLCSEE
jgi:hypothetical protein